MGERDVQPQLLEVAIPTDDMLAGSRLLQFATDERRITGGIRAYVLLRALGMALSNHMIAQQRPEAVIRGLHLDIVVEALKRTDHPGVNAIDPTYEQISRKAFAERASEVAPDLVILENGVHHSMGLKFPYLQI